MTLIPRVLFWMLAHLLWFLPPSHLLTLMTRAEWSQMISLAPGLRSEGVRSPDNYLWNCDHWGSCLPPVVSSLWQWMTGARGINSSNNDKRGHKVSWASSVIPDTGLTRAQIRVILRRSDRSGLGNVNRWLWHTLSVILGNIWLKYAVPVSSAPSLNISPGRLPVPPRQHGGIKSIFTTI